MRRKERESYFIFTRHQIMRGTAEGRTPAHLVRGDDADDGDDDNDGSVDHNDDDAINNGDRDIAAKGRMEGSS
jgi:hypothetical protein